MVKKRVIGLNPQVQNLPDKILKKTEDSENPKNSKNNLTDAVPAEAKPKADPKREAKTKTAEVTEAQKRVRKDGEPEAKIKETREKDDLAKLTDVVLGKRANLDED